MLLSGLLLLKVWTLLLPAPNLKALASCASCRPVCWACSWGPLTDGDALGVDSTKVAVLKQVHDEVFAGL
jgi:hypothetical protein